MFLRPKYYMIQGVYTTYGILMLHFNEKVRFDLNMFETFCFEIFLYLFIYFFFEWLLIKIDSPFINGALNISPLVQI